MVRSSTQKKKIPWKHTHGERGETHWIRSSIQLQADTLTLRRELATPRRPERFHDLTHFDMYTHHPLTAKIMAAGTARRQLSDSHLAVWLQTAHRAGVGTDEKDNKNRAMRCREGFAGC
jgi:hypothetical protein